MTSIQKTQVASENLLEPSPPKPKAIPLDAKLEKVILEAVMMRLIEDSKKQNDDFKESFE